MLQRRKDQLTFQSSREASSIDFIDCATITLARFVTHSCKGAKIFHHGRSKLTDPFLLPRNRFQSLHNPVRGCSTILDRVPPPLELKKISSRIGSFEKRRQKGDFSLKTWCVFECNTSHSSLCLFVLFTDSRYGHR